MKFLYFIMYLITTIPCVILITHYIGTSVSAGVVGAIIGSAIVASRGK